jgi:hypothetical protein
MPNLVTAAQAAALLPGLAAIETTALATLAGPASRSVEKWCRRALAYGTYTEYHRPGPARTIRLKNPPVLPGTVSLRTEYRQILTAQNKDPNAWRATVTLTGGVLTLVTQGGTTTTTPLSLATYTTASALVAAISAVSGWSASTDPAYAGFPTASLEPNPGAMGANTNAAAMLAYVRDLSMWAMDEPQTGLVELTDNRPEEFRFPDRAYGGFGYGQGYGSFSGSDPRVADVRCDYSAGYDPTGTLAPAPPDDLAMAVALTMHSLYEAGIITGTFHSVNLGNTTYEVGTPMAVPIVAQALLSSYVRRSLG